VLPYSEDASCIDSYLERVSGLLVTGGAFDIPPEAYGEVAREGLGPMKKDRTAFESAILRAALERNLPVLGICGGMQLLNVIAGGTLVQDIAREVSNALEHEQKQDRSHAQHPVEIKVGTLVGELLGPGQLMVNSMHHQAVKQPGTDVVVSAVAPDGIAEAIELPRYEFAVGVQWHPENLIHSIPLHLGLYKGLVYRARDLRR
jgi:putative glutamine amidotransferase